MYHTGMRPGSETPTAADDKSYGATTLEKRHLKFTSGGKGATINYVPGKSHGEKKTVAVDDPKMVRILKEHADGKGRVFAATDAKVRDYLKPLGIKPKDLRTLKGTGIAQKEIAAIKDKPKTMKEYHATVRRVSEAVASKLNNTWKVALESYISPGCWKAIHP